MAGHLIGLFIGYSPVKVVGLRAKTMNHTDHWAIFGWSLFLHPTRHFVQINISRVHLLTYSSLILDNHKRPPTKNQPAITSQNGPQEEQEGCQQHQLAPCACHEVRKGYDWPILKEMKKSLYSLTLSPVTLGYKSTLKSLRSGKAKLVIISGNTPPLRKSELEYYSMLSKAPVHHFSGTNVSTFISPLTKHRRYISMLLLCFPFFFHG